jgi:hypothetical protein
VSAGSFLGLLLDVMLIFDCWCVKVLSFSACSSDIGGSGGAE